MFQVWYISPKGIHKCRFFENECELISFISKIKTHARIMQDGQHIGQVFKDGQKWEWFYSLNKQKESTHEIRN